MLLHENLICRRQFEDVIPLYETEFDVYTVSFDGFDGTGEAAYTTAQEQRDKLKDCSCGGTPDLLFAESLGCGPAVFPKASRNIPIHRMILNWQEHVRLESVYAAWKVSLYLYRMLPESRPDAEAAPV